MINEVSFHYAVCRVKFCYKLLINIKVIMGLYKYTLLGSLLAIVFLSGVFLVGSERSSADNTSFERFTVSFEQPQDLGRVMSQIAKSGGNLLALSDSFTPVEDLTITDFYFLKPNKTTKREIINDYQEARKGMIADLNKNALSASAEAETSELKKPKLPVIAGNKMAVEDIQVEGVIFSGSNEQANLFGKGLKASSIRTHKRSNNTTPNENTVDGEVSAASTLVYVNPRIWAPRQGYLYTGESSVAGERYATNYMWWDNVDGFKGMSFRTAYEHDFWLDISDGKTYLNSASTFGNKYPVITYAASTLPEPYLDTRFDDANNGELSYTIGSANAQYITAGDAYYDYNYLRTLNGNASIDNAKVQAQYSKYASGCILAPAFCVFSVEGTPIVTLAPWDVPVPGTRFWSR